MTVTGGGGLLVVIVEVDPEHADELDRWYEHEHLPEKLATPGFRSARRYRDVERPGRFLALYELDDPDLVRSAEYMAQEMSPWSARVMATWSSLDRSVWAEIPRIADREVEPGGGGTSG
jgi:hypothetical protein